MKFIIGEDWVSLLERLSYRGIIGIVYDSTLAGVLSYLLVGLIAFLAVIGLFTVLKWILFGRRPKEDPGKKWLRTGKF